jgi:hypothetical protein
MKELSTLMSGSQMLVKMCNLLMARLEFIEAYKQIKDKPTHFQMKEDLIEHLWNRHPDLYHMEPSS